MGRRGAGARKCGTGVIRKVIRKVFRGYVGIVTSVDDLGIVSGVDGECMVM